MHNAAKQRQGDAGGRECRTNLPHRRDETGARAHAHTHIGTNVSSPGQSSCVSADV